MMDPKQVIARTAAAVFGGKSKVTRFWDHDERSWVDLVECADSPTAGVTAFSMIALSDHPLLA